MRRVKVEAKETHNADGAFVHASVTSFKSGKGDNEMSVSEDRVEYFTSDDID